MRLLVLGGTHGNELLGIRLVESLQRDPLPGVDAVIANPLAVQRAVRFVETDLNRSFGDQPDDTWERRRAKELTDLFGKYDIVLDFHNTQTPANNCCFTGIDSDPRLYVVAAKLGLRHCIQATYDCLNKYSPNVLSVEISVDDRWDSVLYWRDMVRQITNGKVTRKQRALQVYRYARRVTWAEQQDFQLTGWQPFAKLALRETTLLGVSAGAVPIFIGSRLTEYYATLLEPVETTPLRLQITDKDDRITTI